MHILLKKRIDFATPVAGGAKVYGNSVESIVRRIKTQKKKEVEILSSSSKRLSPSIIPSSEQRFGGQDGGYPSTRLHQVPVRENRVEVRIHDYRRDQGITNDAVGIWQQRQRRHRGAQNPSGNQFYISL